MALAARPPAPKEPSTRSAPKAPPPVHFDPDDDTVEIAWLGPTEADLLAGELIASGIPAMVVGVSPLTGEAGAALRFAEGSRLLVRRRDEEAARAIVERPPNQPISDDELAAQAEAAAGTDFGDGAVV